MSRDLRRALAVVALDESGEIRVVRSAVAEFGGDPDVLLGAEALGALCFDVDRVEFVVASHRAVIVANLAPDEAVGHRTWEDFLADRVLSDA